jgi:hypothetical protein
LSAGQAGFTPNKKMQRHGFQGRFQTSPPQSDLFLAMSVSHTGTSGIPGSDLSSFSARFQNLRADSAGLSNGFFGLGNDFIGFWNGSFGLGNDFVGLGNDSVVFGNGFAGLGRLPQAWDMISQV